MKAVAYEKDRYGRTIATLFLDGQGVNLAIIDAGLAWHYKRYVSEQVCSEAAAYSRSKLVARDKKLALWSVDEPIAPWEWRATRSSLVSRGAESQAQHGPQHLPKEVGHD